MATKLNDKYLSDFIGEHEYDGVAAEVKAAHKVLHDGSGLGNDFLGWLNLPTDYDKEEFARIKKCAEKIKFDEKQYNQSLPLIKTQLKALIARDLWDMNEYFQVMNSTNQSVQQALKVLNEGIYSTIIQ